jgi:hypothetical protein
MGALLIALLLFQQELIERTLALVGGQAITLSDARAAIALGLVDAGGSQEPTPAVTSQLVDRALVLREVMRYAPAAPADSAVGARLEEIRKRAGGVAPLATLLDQYGFTEVRVLALIRDELRTQAYLSQRFASASTPTDAEVSAAYARSRAEFDQAGTTFEQAAPIVRDRLVAARRRELIADWISDLRRRTDVVILQQ